MIIINIEDENELFDTFEEENRIALTESILSNLEVVQDRCKTNGRTQDRPYQISRIIQLA